MALIRTHVINGNPGARMLWVPKFRCNFVAELPSPKLVVILHADVVGSMVLVQHDETVAHQRIQDSFRRFSETIGAYGGVTHELRGDALVAGFERASDAVCAGIAFQADNNQNPVWLRFNVKSVDDAAQELLDKGIKAKIRKEIWGTVGDFMDPDGNICSFREESSGESSF